MKLQTLLGLWAIIITIGITGGCHCDDNEPVLEGDYLIFGHFYGKCQGEQCRETFIIEEGQLFEDELDHYPNSTGPNEFSFGLLSDATYNEVAELPGFFPAELYDIPNGTIGTPDAGDWGGYYVQTTRNGEVRYWLIDTKKENIPTSLHDFTDKVRDAIFDINN